MAKNTEKLSLEVYLRFFLPREQDAVAVNFLTQNGLNAAVNKLDVIDPSRFPLKANISSSAIISVEDINADLNNFNWQEDCVKPVSLSNSLEAEQ